MPKKSIGGILQFMKDGGIAKLQDGNPIIYGYDKDKDIVVPNWFDNIFEQKYLIGWNNKLRQEHSQQTGIDPARQSHSHYSGDSLRTAYRMNDAYTEGGSDGDNGRGGDYVGQDIQTFYNTHGNNMGLEDYVNFYNSNAQKIRDYWSKNTAHQYNEKNARAHNQLFKAMFNLRSGAGNAIYDIGYDPNQEDIHGSSTWLRRMDRYEKEFEDLDPNDKEALRHRIHAVKLGDGTTGYVYKKANGDIGIWKGNPEDLNPQPENPENPTNPGIPSTPIQPEPQKPRTQLNINPGDIMGLGRVIYDTQSALRRTRNYLRHINPLFIHPYHTYHQIYGDNATKAYYENLGKQGMSKAKMAISADANINNNTMLEALRNYRQAAEKGNLAWNEMARKTAGLSAEHSYKNAERDNTVANTNRKSMNATERERAGIEAYVDTANQKSWDNFFMQLEKDMREKYNERRAAQRYYDDTIATGPEYDDTLANYQN